MWYVEVKTGANKDEMVIEKIIARTPDTEYGRSVKTIKTRMLKEIKASIEALLEFHGYKAGDLIQGYDAEVFVDVPDANSTNFDRIDASKMRLSFLDGETLIVLENGLNYLSDNDTRY